jgi:hypothetical protein
MLTATRTVPSGDYKYTHNWELSTLNGEESQEQKPAPLWIVGLLVLAWMGGMYIIFRRKTRQ